MNKPFLSIALLLLSMLSLQGGSALAKQLLSVFGSWGAAGIRTGLASLLLALFFPIRFSLIANHLGLLALYGSLLGLMNLTFYAALQHLPLGTTVTLELIGPLGLSLYLSQKWTDTLWAVLAGLGIYLMMPSGEGNILGVCLALLAGLWWALYIIVGSKVAARLPTQQGITVGMFFAALLCVSVWLFSSDVSVGDFSMPLLRTGLLVAFLSSALPYALELRVLESVSPRIFGILMSLEPAIAALMGFLFLSERLDTQGWWAIACVIIASIGVSWQQQKSTEL